MVLQFTTRSQGSRQTQRRENSDMMYWVGMYKRSFFGAQRNFCLSKCFQFGLSTSSVVFVLDDDLLCVAPPARLLLPVNTVF